MGLEEEVDVYPVVGELVERMIRERISDVENVSVHFLSSISRQVCGEHMSRRVEQHVADPAREACEEEVLVHGASDAVCLGEGLGALLAELVLDTGEEGRGGDAGEARRHCGTLFVSVRFHVFWCEGMGDVPRNLYIRG